MKHMKRRPMSHKQHKHSVTSEIKLQFMPYSAKFSVASAYIRFLVFTQPSCLLAFWDGLVRWKFRQQSLLLSGHPLFSPPRLICKTYHASLSSHISFIPILKLSKLIKRGQYCAEFHKICNTKSQAFQTKKV